MTITFIGYFVIPISLYFFVKNEIDSLFYLFTFFSPFFASSIIILENSTFGMQPSYWIGILFIISVVINAIKTHKIKLLKRQKRFFLIIGLFWIIALISLSYPFLLRLLDLKPVLINPLLTIKDISSNVVATEFQSYLITQFLYLTFYLLIVTAILIYVDSLEKIIITIRVLVFSAFFICCWGLFVQLPSFFIGFEYPSWIFNNHPGYAQGVSQTVWAENRSLIPRICSVSVEPSMLSFFLIMITGLLISPVFSKEVTVFRNRTIQAIMFLVIVVTTIITTSSTAYVGLSFIYVMSMFILLGQRRLSILKIKQILWCFIYFPLFLLFLLLFLTSIYLDIDVSILISVLESMTLNKFMTGSGIERWEGFLRGINIFFDSLFIGTGWGSNSTYDLTSTLLANIGLIGLTVFSLMLYFPLRYLFYVYKEKKCINPQIKIISLSLIVSFTSAVIMHIVSISSFAHMFYWIIYGLILSIPMAVRKLPCQVDNCKIEFPPFFDKHSAGVRSSRESCGRCSLYSIIHQ